MTIEVKPQGSIVKKIIYILSCILVIILIAGIFMPKDVSTSISKNIDVPAHYAFNLANNVHSVSSWNAWIKEDSTTQLEFGSIALGKQASYQWKSEKFGAGTMTIKESIQNKKINAQLTMEGEHSEYTQHFNETEKGSIIQWDFKTHMKYPKNVFAPFLMYMINKKNKQSIDFMVEEIQQRKKGKYYGYQITEQSQNPKYFVTSRSVVQFDQIPQFYTQNLSAIYVKLQEAGITASGAPCALFYSYDESGQKTDMAVAVPVLTPSAVKDLSSESFPALNAAMIDFYGDNSKNQIAHYALNDYTLDRRYSRSYPIIEEYVTDPIKEKDQNKWLTKIYYYTIENK